MGSEGFRIPANARIEVEPNRRAETPDWVHLVRPNAREIICQYCKLPSEIRKVIVFPLPHGEKLAQINPERFAGKVMWKCPKCHHVGGCVSKSEWDLEYNGIEL